MSPDDFLRMPSLEGADFKARAFGIKEGLAEVFNPPIVSNEIREKAKSIAGKHNEGMDLIKVGMEQFGAEQGVIEELDLAKTTKNEAKAGITSQISVLGKVLLGITPNEADVANLEQLGNNPAKFARDLIEAKQLKDKAKARRKELRGKLPLQSLKHEARIVDDAEGHQAGQIEAGLRVMDLFGDKAMTDLSMTDLRQGTAIAKTARSQANWYGQDMGDLKARLDARYPDQRDDIKVKYEQIVEDNRIAVDADRWMSTRKNVVEVDGDPNSVDQETKTLVDAKAHELMETAGLTGDESNETMRRILGIEKDDTDPNILKATKGGWLAKYMQHELAVKVGSEDFKKVMEAAKDDPRLAEAAVTVALVGRGDARVRDITMEKMKREILEQRAMQKFDLKLEAMGVKATEVAEGMRNEFKKVVDETKIVGTEMVGVTGNAVGTVVDTIGKMISKVGGLFKSIKGWTDKIVDKQMGNMETESTRNAARKAELQSQMAELQRQMDSLS